MFQTLCPHCPNSQCPLLITFVNFREDIFWGKGKDVSEASEAEREADTGERWQNASLGFSTRFLRLDENPLAYGDNRNKYL